MAQLLAFAPDTVHRRCLDAARPVLAWTDERPPTVQRVALADKLAELLACPEAQGDLDLEVESRRCGDGFTETRFSITSEPGARIPCHLLVPENAQHPQVFLCLQGHTSGMHLSLDEKAEGDRAFGLQAVRRGHAALAIEIRGFGERRDRRPAAVRDPGYEADSLDPNVTCKHAAMVALLLGRTSLGEKILDVRCVLDALAQFPEVDGTRVHVIGNSGGGTLAWYAACVEPRLQGLVVGSCFATYASSIGSVDHCCDNYLPGALPWFDFPDLALLVAPRPLVVVMGRDDRLFPLAGVEGAFERARTIYAGLGAEDRCRLVLCDGGHRFYANEAWAAFGEIVDAGKQ
jgi:pimeloyl-ACP methyl ester carboxylesterase